MEGGGRVKFKINKEWLEKQKEDDDKYDFTGGSFFLGMFVPCSRCALYGVSDKCPTCHGTGFVKVDQ